MCQTCAKLKKIANYKAFFVGFIGIISTAAIFWHSTNEANAQTLKHTAEIISLREFKATSEAKFKEIDKKLDAIDSKLDTIIWKVGGK